MKNSLKNNSDQNRKKIGVIIEDLRVAILTTYNKQGRLSNRPMQVQEVDSQGVLWFFSSYNSRLIEEINLEPEVNLVFANSDKNEYLTASGLAEETQDLQKMQELWNPSLKTWYAQGLDTPGICLIKVEMDEVDFWDAPQANSVRFSRFAEQNQPLRA